MSDEPSRTDEADERAEEMREQHREAQEHNPDERRPGERGEGQDATEEGLLGGLPGSIANRPTG